MRSFLNRVGAGIRRGASRVRQLFGRRAGGGGGRGG